MKPFEGMITLIEPFIRHPVGLVFELSEATGVSGWEDDDRLREKLNFSDKRTYHLPDGGNGMAYDLPVSKTAICPPEVFENEDLRTGPCRVTGAQEVEGDTVRNSDWKYTIKLVEINGTNAQGLVLPVPEQGNPPISILLRDRLREIVIRETASFATENGILDFSDLLPGFYQFEIQFSPVLLYRIQFIKSFPLLVIIHPNRRFTTQKTLY